MDVSGPASLESLESRAILLLLLVFISKSLSSFLHKIGVTWLSETAVYMVTGLSAALLLSWKSLLPGAGVGGAGNGEGEGYLFRMSSRFFYMALLPPIVFEGGYSLQRLLFFNNFTLIFSLAFVGGLYSTVVTSLVLFGLGRLVAPSLSLVASLVFGSLISSTDPVTVLALLPENLDKRLYMIIFGESALNDAVAVILYRFFTLLATSSTGGSLQSLTFGAFCLSVAQSAGVFVGSTLVGLAIGLGFALVTKYWRMPEPVIFESVIFIIFAYGSYLAAECLGMTGIISVFFCGLGMAHYSTDNLDEMTLISTKVILRVFSTFCEGFVFIYLGMGLVGFGRENTTYSLPFTAVALFAILLARTHVFLICSISSFFSSSPSGRIPFKHQVLIWFSGLRGAVAFALSVTILDYQAFPPKIRSLLFGTGVLVVTFTVIVFGGLTPVVLKLLRIQEDSTPLLGSPDTIIPTPGAAETGYLDESSSGKMVGWVRWLYLLDKRHLRPLFSNPPRRLVILPDPQDQRPHELIYGAPQSTVELTAPDGLILTHLGSRTKVLGSFGSLNTTPSVRDAYKDKMESSSYEDIGLNIRTAGLGSNEFVAQARQSGPATPKSSASLNMAPNNLRSEGSYLNPGATLPPILSHSSIAAAAAANTSNSLGSLGSTNSSLTSLVLRASASSLSNVDGSYSSTRSSRRPTDPVVMAGIPRIALPPLPSSTQTQNK